MEPRALVEGVLITAARPFNIQASDRLKCRPALHPERGGDHGGVATTLAQKSSRLSLTSLAGVVMSATRAR